MTELELRLLAWFAARLGLPETAGGYLTSGGSAANHDALVIARDLKAGWDVRRVGMAGGPRLTTYAPATAHDTIQRGADMAGMGSGWVRSVPVDDRDHVDLAALRAAIERDRAAGHQPICVVGSAGTVGSGAIDDLTAIADVADELDLWFHVDGAVGAVGAMTTPLHERFAGIERADSVSLDRTSGCTCRSRAGCCWSATTRRCRARSTSIPRTRSRTRSAWARALTCIDGRFVLRACIVNYRTEADDIEALIDLTVEIGDRLADRPTSAR